MADLPIVESSIAVANCQEVRGTPKTKEYGNKDKGAGGRGEARELSNDQIKASKEIGKLLVKEGILFAGIDMIGNYLTEINITSPTGAREILSQTGQNPIKAFLQSI